MTGRWVQRGLVKVWDDSPPPPKYRLSDLIACPTCRATVTQSCRVVKGASKGKPKGDHVLRLVKRQCVCGNRLQPRRQLCDECAAAETRASKRDYMRRRRAGQKEAA